MMIDTLTTARTLERRGFTKDQAESLTEVMRAAVSENVATKSDLAEQESDIKSEFASLRAEFAGLKAEIAKQTVWMIGEMIFVAGFAVTIDILLK